MSEREREKEYFANNSRIEKFSLFIKIKLFCHFSNRPLKILLWFSYRLHNHTNTHTHTHAHLHLDINLDRMNGLDSRESSNSPWLFLNRTENDVIQVE